MSNRSKKKPTNECILDKYLNHYRHSNQSVKMRESSLNYFFGKEQFNYIGHIFDIKTQLLIDYFDWLKNLDGISITTRRNKWAILVSFLQFVMEYYRDYNFIVVIPSKTINWNGAIPKNGKKKSNKNVYATPEEVQAILNHLKKHNFKHYLIFRLFAETGIRKGELINLKIDEINIDKRYVNPHKGKTGEKYYFFTENLANYLKVYLKERETIKTKVDYFFLTKFFKKYGNRAFNLILKNIRDQLKIEKNITCHTFRRSINDLRKEMECPNEDRKSLVGHAVHDVNVESYTNSDLKRLQMLYDRWNPYKELNL